MEMVTSSEKSEALSGVAMIELFATIVSPSIFGVIFTLLSKADKINDIFLINGVIALVSAAVVVLIRLPPRPDEIDDGMSETNTERTEYTDHSVHTE